MEVNDINGKPLDIGDYVKNVKTLRVGHIFKIVREKTWQGVRTTVRCETILPAGNGSHYAQGLDNLMKCDSQGFPVV